MCEVQSLAESGLLARFLGWNRGWRHALALVCLCALGWTAQGAVVITNVATANVTASGFTVVWVDAPALSRTMTPTIAIYADAAGTTSLAGQVGVEWYPLNSGSPTATNAYQQRQSQSLLRQESRGLGFTSVRVSGCAPNTTYYYRVGVSDTNGPLAAWPAAGPLPAATTAQANSFVADSLQLVLNVSPQTPPGAIILLSNTNTPSLLAAVVGDGAGSNQVYFNLSEVLSATGGTNYTPTGVQEFTARELGSGPGSAPATYDLTYNSSFTAGLENQFTLGSYVSLAIGQAVAQAGQSGSVPIQLLYGSGITNLTVAVALPTGDFSALSVQLVSGQLNSASLQIVNPGLISLNFGAGYGQSLQGAQALAQLNFTVGTNAPSTVLGLPGQLQQALNLDGSSVTNSQTQAGQLVIVGPRPILQALPAPPGETPNLVLYGHPGTNYQLQFTTELGNPAAWRNLAGVVVTNLPQVVSGLATNVTGVFYRAY